VAALAILQPDARATARLTGALGDGHRIVRRRSWDGLEQAVERGEVTGCLVDADHPGRVEARRRIARLRGRYPTLAIIAYVHEPGSDGFFDLGGVGVDELVTSATPRQKLRSRVDQAFARARAEQVAQAFQTEVDSPFSSALSWAVAHATHETSVATMADALGHSTRGLRDALADAGHPTPARILVWGRLLLAGARLAEDGRSAEEVAFALGYATSTSLARAMKQHTGYTPREISEGGGLRLVLRALLADGRGPWRGVATLHRIAGLAALAFIGGCATFGVDRSAIDDVLGSPGIEQMHVGVLAVDARTGRVLYARNAARKFVPASNQKLLVTAAAMTMLGPDHRFRTSLWGTGPVVDGTLEGNLVLIGTGDPTLSARFWPSGTAALEALADSLSRAGLEYVKGSLLVDVSAWDSATVGPTWEVEDLRYAYGSTGGAFAVDEGEIQLVVEAGPHAGAPVEVRWTPFGSDDFVRSRVKTAAPDSATRIRPSYQPETRQLVLEGVAEAGTVDTVAYALRDPVREASASLARAIQSAGIEIEVGWAVRWMDGESVGGSCVSGSVAECPDAIVLASLESPPLSEVVAGILEPSQNWMTEQLIRALAADFGEEGSWSEGTDVVEAFLFDHVGVDTLDVAARDGSGLSAYNLVTPRALVRVLRHMRDGPHGEAYRQALAEPGEEDSSLERRLLDLRGRVFAKTGTISNVNSLSGYLVREDGEEVVFSILTNASGLPSSYVRDAIDDIVRALSR
jgi:D-alanyl-D-alanine carboxypeptidase/D-alanyl-D-alanine-endopeptidase (penicillin-binding protein 4)